MYQVILGLGMIEVRASAFIGRSLHRKSLQIPLKRCACVAAVQARAIRRSAPLPRQTVNSWNGPSFTARSRYEDDMNQCTAEFAAQISTRYVVRFTCDLTKVIAPGSPPKENDACSIERSSPNCRYCDIVFLNGPGAGPISVRQWPRPGRGRGRSDAGQSGTRAGAALPICRWRGQRGARTGGAAGAGTHGPELYGRRLSHGHVSSLDNERTLVRRFGDEAGDERVRRSDGGCCILGATVYDVGHIAVVHDAMGLTWVKGARIDMKLPWNQQDNTVAPKQALRLCLESSFGCELSDKRGGGILRSSHDPGTDHSKDYFPAGPVKRHHWIMVARPAKNGAGRMAEQELA